MTGVGVLFMLTVLAQNGLVNTSNSPKAKLTVLAWVMCNGQRILADRFAVCRDVVPQLWQTYTSTTVIFLQNFRIAAGLDSGNSRPFFS